MRRRKSSVKSCFAVLLVVSMALIVLLITHFSLKQQQTTQIAKTTNNFNCTCVKIESPKNVHVDRVNKTIAESSVTHASNDEIVSSSSSNVNSLIQSAEASSNVRNNSNVVQTSINSLRDNRFRSYENTSHSFQENINSKRSFSEQNGKTSHLEVSRYRDSVSAMPDTILKNTTNIQFRKVDNNIRQKNTTKKRILYQLMNKTVHSKLEASSSKINLPITNIESNNTFTGNNKVSDNILTLSSTEKLQSTAPIVDEPTMYYTKSVKKVHNESILNDKIGHKKFQKGSPGVSVPESTGMHTSHDFDLNHTRMFANTLVNSTINRRRRAGNNSRAIVGSSYNVKREINLRQNISFNIRRTGDNVGNDTITNGHLKQVIDNGKSRKLTRNQDIHQIERQIPKLLETTTKAFVPDNLKGNYSRIFVRRNITTVEKLNKVGNHIKLPQNRTKVNSTVKKQRRTRKKSKTVVASSNNIKREIKLPQKISYKIHQTSENVGNNTITNQIGIKVPKLLETTAKTFVHEKLKGNISSTFVMRNVTTVDSLPKITNRTKLPVNETKVPFVRETTTKFDTTNAVSLNMQKYKWGYLSGRTAYDKLGYGRPIVRQLHNITASAPTETIHGGKFQNGRFRSLPNRTNGSSAWFMQKNVAENKLFQPIKSPKRGRFINFFPIYNRNYSLPRFRETIERHVSESRPFTERNRIGKKIQYKTKFSTPNQVTFMPTTSSAEESDPEDPYENLPARNDTCSACFQNNFTILLNPKKICKLTSTIDILILIASSPSEKVKRDQIRRTWGLNCNRKTSTMKCVFVVGNFGNRFDKNQHDAGSFGSFSMGQRELEMEGNLNNDIVQFDFVDSYRNLTYKTLSALRWAATFCKTAKHVMKTDTDMFVNTYLLPILVKQIPKTLFFGGHCWGQSSPHRDFSSKWFVSFRQYRHDLFPEMCSGTGYILSADLVRLILKRSFDIPFFYLEDVYISLCLKGTGVQPRRLAGFFNEEEQFEACHYKTEVITSHLIDPEMLQQYWNEVNTCHITILSDNIYREIPYPDV